MACRTEGFTFPDGEGSLLFCYFWGYCRYQHLVSGTAGHGIQPAEGIALRVNQIFILLKDGINENGDTFGDLFGKYRTLYLRFNLYIGNEKVKMKLVFIFGQCIIKIICLYSVFVPLAMTLASIDIKCIRK